MKRIIQMVGMSLTMLILASCTEKLEGNSIQSDEYTKYFNLTEIEVESWGYLDVSVANSISKSDVEKYIVGGGWKSVAVYEIDKNKSIVGIKEIKNDYPIEGNQTLSDCFEVKGFGGSQLIQYGLVEGRYEDLEFSYDETDNSISLDACWFVAHNGKLVYLSDKVMVCVDAKRWVSEGRSPFAYMVVFEKVGNSTLREWRKKCPVGGLWI